MKCNGIVVTVLVTLLAARAGAAPFVNLDFEQAIVPAGWSQNYLPAAQAFPGWTARIQGVIQNFVNYNYEGAGEPTITLYDRQLADGDFVSQGRYSAYLVGGAFPPVSLEQT